jgi:thiamine-phosphate pyrophosphorylase
MRGVYPIIDVDAARATSVDWAVLADRALSVRPFCLQLRAKTASARETLLLLRALRARCRPAGVLLFANDRPDLAALADCDGVHLGQDDIPIEVVRRQFPQLKVGLSTHSEEQLAAALKCRPDYVAFGPVFPTHSKKDPDQVVGLAGLRRARSLVTSCPLVAIGGISFERAREVSPYADMAAVISALLVAGATGDSQLSEIHQRFGGV